MSLFRSKPSGTFKPKSGKQKEGPTCELTQISAATLGSGNLRLAVQLPEGEDLNEWIAVNTVDFFSQISMLYGTLTDFCTEKSCPVMMAGPKYEYLWADGQNVKKPIKCSAPVYIDYLMSWVQEQLDTETIFPSKIGAAFPRNFLTISKNILKRLFRVYAHIYHQHFSEVCQLQEEAHLNTSFKHFLFFVTEFSLIEKRELAPLQELIEHLLKQYEQQGSASCHVVSGSSCLLPTSITLSSAKAVPGKPANNVPTANLATPAVEVEATNVNSMESVCYHNSGLSDTKSPQ